VFPPVEGLLRDTGFSNQGYHGFTAEHPVHHFPSEMWRVLAWHVIAPFEAHDGTTLVNNGQYLGVTSPGPKTRGRSVYFSKSKTGLLLEERRHTKDNGWEILISTEAEKIPHDFPKPKLCRQTSGEDVKNVRFVY
jgi:hypothetical protein